MATKLAFYNIKSPIRRLCRIVQGVIGATLVYLVVTEPDVFAQTTSSTVSAYADGFRPVPGGKPLTDEVNASLLVVSAYGMFALAFISYLIYLGREQSRLSKEIQELGARIKNADGK